MATLKISNPNPESPSPSPPADFRPRHLRMAASAGSKFADFLFRNLTVACGFSVLLIVGLIFVELIQRSHLSLQKFGFAFFSGRSWDPVAGEFGSLPFIYGTVISSFLALLLAVPLAVGLATFLTEMCSISVRGPLSFITELLAAIPSVIYGLWAIFVLVPLMRQYIQPGLARSFRWTGLFEGPPYGIGMLTAGVVLAIMIIPVISSITREVLNGVPRQQREAALALGATRWEMIRIAVLPNARTGIFGAIILGLGRALGETMAVTMVIGNRAEIAKSLLAPGYSMASVIGNEFSEASDELYLSALIEIGLALFLVTIVVNAAARLLVWSTTRGVPASVHAQ